MTIMIKSHSFGGKNATGQTTMTIHASYLVQEEVDPKNAFDWQVDLSPEIFHRPSLKNESSCERTNHRYSEGR